MLSIRVEKFGRALRIGSNESSRINDSNEPLVDESDLRSAGGTRELKLLHMQL